MSCVGCVLYKLKYILNYYCVICFTLISTGNTAPFHITQPSTDNDVQIVSPTATMVTLTCSLNITIPSSLFVRWLYNGNLMMGSTNGNTARLQIRNLAAAAGVYQCVFTDVFVGWTIRRNIRLNIIGMDLTWHYLYQKYYKM